MLSVRQLQAYYGKSCVLRGVEFDLAPGQILALLGRNGAGRSTTLKALMGLVHCTGSVQWQPSGAAKPRQLVGLKPFEIARAGIGYVAENREIFPGLTVEQNLLLGQQKRCQSQPQLQPQSLLPLLRRSSDSQSRIHSAQIMQGTQEPWTLARVYERFAHLKARQHVPAGALSGGEQQMLALCRTLMGNPQLVLVDEPTEGLAPLIVEQVAELLALLRQQGVAILLVEQKSQFALRMADSCMLMGHGRIVFNGSPQELEERVDLQRQWLQV